VENRSQSVAEGEPEWLRVQRSFQDNTIAVSGQLLVGSRPEPVSVAEVYPNQAFLQVFRQELQAAGVRVGNANITTEPARLKGVEIAGVASPTVGELVQRTNRVSDNLYAEVLLRWLGTTQANDGTSAAQRGLVAMEQTLMQLGVDAAAIRPNDGSGLSRLNWVTPRGLVQTLQGMARTPHAQIFRDSLPVAGESGTLSYRLGDNGAVVRAKTGTLSGVSALSGYLEHPAYGTLTFAVLVNQSDRPTAEQREAIDNMVRLLTQVRPCSG
jgi:D-alanyl-D-alanine carboxypeptidase/D-alanyl-D-alanine-endopeptidase (penicillin-binding protein 4)